MSVETPGRPFRTYETVAADTPTARAMSAAETRIPRMPALLVSRCTLENIHSRPSLDRAFDRAHLVAERGNRPTPARRSRRDPQLTGDIQGRFCDRDDPLDRNIGSQLDEATMRRRRPAPHNGTRPSSSTAALWETASSSVAPCSCNALFQQRLDQDRRDAAEAEPVHGQRRARRDVDNGLYVAAGSVTVAGEHRAPHRPGPALPGQACPDRSRTRGRDARSRCFRAPENREPRRSRPRRR